MRSLFPLIAACVVGLIASTAPVDDPDVFWHIASGRWMLDHRQLLDHDVYSFTKTNQPYWVAQWLGQVVYASLFNLGSWPGLASMRGLIIGGATFFASRALLRVQPGVFSTLLPLSFFVLISTLIWGDRPQLFSLFLFPFFFDTLLRAWRSNDSKGVYLLIPALFLWSNLHGAYLLGVLILGAFTFCAWFSRPLLRRSFTAVFALGSLSTLLAPYAFSTLALATSYASSASLVAEERPLDPTRAAGVLFLLMVFSVVALSLTKLPSLFATRRLPNHALLWVVLLVPFTYLGVSHQRQLPYAALLYACLLSSLLPQVRLSLPTLAPVSAGVRRLVTLALLGLTLVTGFLLAPPQPDLSTYPEGALATLRTRPGNLFHEYNWGGYLIYTLPAHPTFIDGRGAALYPPSHVDAFMQTARAKGDYAGVLRANDIAFVLLRPGWELVDVLKAQGWVVLSEKAERWVLLQRP